MLSRCWFYRARSRVLIWSQSSLIDRGTSVAVELPTYLAALQVFRFFGASMQSFDANTLHADIFRQQSPSLVYAIPTFRIQRDIAIQLNSASARCGDEHRFHCLKMIRIVIYFMNRVIASRVCAKLN